MSDKNIIKRISALCPTSGYGFAIIPSNAPRETVQTVLESVLLDRMINAAGTSSPRFKEMSEVLAGEPLKYGDSCGTRADQLPALVSAGQPTKMECDNFKELVENCHFFYTREKKTGLEKERSAAFHLIKIQLGKAWTYLSRDVEKRRYEEEVKNPPPAGIVGDRG